MDRVHRTVSMAQKRSKAHCKMDRGEELYPGTLQEGQDTLLWWSQPSLSCVGLPAVLSPAHPWHHDFPFLQHQDHHQCLENRP